MRIAIVLTPLTDHYLRLAAQVGVEDVVTRYPGTDRDELMRLRDRIASFGMKLSIVEGYIPKDKIVHDKPGRDEQIADIQKLIRNMGAAGVPICCYNWMPCDDWTRTRVDIPERGGALVTGYNVNDDKQPPVHTNEALDEKTIWANLKYMLDRIAPVAEEAGVKLAMHPDDPPLSTFRGHAQIMSSVKGFERLLDLHASPANGICFCQGTFAEIGVAIPAAIQKFAKRIHYVHFRDVVGTASNFRESFHDNGKTDMAAAMHAYYECGIDVPARPDHVPTLDGEANDPAGYTMMGRLFAVGYMRGLMHAVGSR